MSRNPEFLAGKEMPDQQLLIRIKNLSEDKKTVKEMKKKLPGTSIEVIRRYYMKIRRGIW